MSFFSRAFRSSSKLGRKQDKPGSSDQKSRNNEDSTKRPNNQCDLDFDTPRPDEGEVKCVNILIVGAGSRGKCYSYYAVNFPKRMKVVGVADPRSCIRDDLKKIHNIDEDNVFEDWTEAAAREKFADGVVIATPDRLHKDPAIAFAKKGYHILLEKPMAELIDSAVIGDVVHIQHMEPVGHWHFAHSYVRGNWRNEKESTFSLLAKSCHDIDLICFWMGKKRCVKVSSFGTLSHFTKDNKPKDASSRCLDCSVEETCPYSAKRIYLKEAEQGFFSWPVSVVCSNGIFDIESLTEALRTGPYGRCVYECDNDVVSHQVVNMEFEGGLTAAFTMMGFTKSVGVRTTTIYGTRGELYCRGNGPVEVFDFVTNKTTPYPYMKYSCMPMNLMGHAGADFYLMDSFISALSNNDPSLIQTGPDETLRSHLLVFEAEKSRRGSCVVHL
ncbi:uncharacterized protein LOC142497361 isoform X2 [Ascaphus truei]|uniref:uncharacterized protein LOC142497361 isoform X2 n=1 Tax=Ascaphus truei TaxID=8439 RepID=UPI003F596032